MISNVTPPGSEGGKKVRICEIIIQNFRIRIVIVILSTLNTIFSQTVRSVEAAGTLLLSVFRYQALLSESFRALSKVRHFI